MLNTKENREARFVSRLTRDTVALILAGGRGSRLKDLTNWRAKPAVPFGGKFRIIDFPLSNCLNSGIRRIAVLTQLQPLSEALEAAGQRLRALKRGLRRLGVPPLAMISLDDLERLSLFEADFKRHDAAFAAQHELFGRQQLYTMLNDIAGGDSGD